MSGLSNIEITQEELDKIGTKAFIKFNLLCRVHKIEYLSLDKTMQKILLQCFVEGVKFVREEIEQARKT